MRAEGQCAAGGSWVGTHVPLPQPRRTGLDVVEAVERAHARRPVIRLTDDATVTDISDPNVRYMVTAYLAGASIFDIARHVHRAQSTVRRQLVEHGVQIRRAGRTS